MKKISAVALCAVMVVVLVLLLEAPVMRVEAVNCDAYELSSCRGAFTSNATPSDTCCQKLKEQQPCFCGYLKNPSIGQYVNATRAKEVAAACQVAIPNC
ncbi:hypothetical protein L6164_006463 [Bauhinia variegata]|uniref:Uncharacterized protein n=1 Tax=Bauhinia variegata TaxID=167791 RepID=A0ACB9PWC9_BAUVA|nr:hypothetical protein L6164_006463 [Bauhinia variegata]